MLTGGEPGLRTHVSAGDIVAVSCFDGAFPDPERPCCHRLAKCLVSPALACCWTASPPSTVAFNDKRRGSTDAMWRQLRGCGLGPWQQGKLAAHSTLEGSLAFVMRPP